MKLNFGLVDLHYRLRNIKYSCLIHDVAEKFLPYESRSATEILLLDWPERLFASIVQHFLYNQMI